MLAGGLAANRPRLDNGAQIAMLEQYVASLVGGDRSAPGGHCVAGVISGDRLNRIWSVDGIKPGP